MSQSKTITANKKQQTNKKKRKKKKHPFEPKEIWDNILWTDETKVEHLRSYESRYIWFKTNTSTDLWLSPTKQCPP